MAKKINLIELTAETGLIRAGAKRPENLFDYCFETESDIQVIKTLDYTAENVKKAGEWLAEKRNTCKRMSGPAGDYYAVECYAIEHYDVDDDGDYIDGSDYDAAAEDEEESPAEKLINAGLYDQVVELMDDEIREEVHADLAPCTDLEFLTEYIARHERKYGEVFDLFVKTFVR